MSFFNLIFALDIIFVPLFKVGVKIEMKLNFHKIQIFFSPNFFSHLNLNTNTRIRSASPLHKTLSLVLTPPDKFYKKYFILN